MRELSLFSGAGGGLLGSLLLGWEPIGYVEFNDYCQRVIAQRIKDGILPNAPIFGDVRTFVSSGCAELYRGVADVISGGFPCQPFSVAGKRAGADDERNMWPATIATIRAVRPRFAFLENVPGLLTSGYFGTILGDLAESGYDARWRILSAAELGAPHKRDRLWIVGYANGGDDSGRKLHRGDVLPSLDGRTSSAFDATDSGFPYVAHSASEQDRRLQQPELSPHAGTGSQDVGDSTGEGLQDGRGAQMGRPQPQPQPQRPSWWIAEPNVGRLADGVPNRVDRLKAAGNAQVPIVAATAWHLLTEGLNDD